MTENSLLLTLMSRAPAGGDRPRARSQRRQLDGVENLRVSRAATEIAGQRLADLLASGGGRVGEEGLGREQDAGRAVAALGRPQLREGLLKRMELPSLGHALHGGDGA